MSRKRMLTECNGIRNFSQWGSRGEHSDFLFARYPVSVDIALQPLPNGQIFYWNTSFIECVLDTGAGGELASIRI